MAKDGAMPEHIFSTQNYYMFYWDNKGTPKISVENTVWVNKESDSILFQTDDGRGKFDSSVPVNIKKADIIAVKDENGLVEIEGFSGKHIVLNQELFNKYIEEKVIELKK